MEFSNVINDNNVSLKDSLEFVKKMRKSHSEALYKSKMKYLGVKPRKKSCSFFRKKPQSLFKEEKKSRLNYIASDFSSLREIHDKFLDEEKKDNDICIDDEIDVISSRVLSRLNKNQKKYDLNLDEHIKKITGYDLAKNRKKKLKRSSFSFSRVLRRKKKKRKVETKPFSFEKRESLKRTSIRDKKFKKYLLERENEKKNWFQGIKAKPVPKNVIIPKFDKLMAEKGITIKKKKPKEPDDDFKVNVVTDSLKKTQKKTGWKKIKAVPVPKTTKMLLLEKMGEGGEFDLERKKRIRRRSLMTMRKSFLPKGFEKYKKKNGNESKKDIATFQPKIKRSFPNFTKLHQSFSKKLLDSKRAIPITKIKEFSFAKRNSDPTNKFIKTVVDVNNGIWPEKRKEKIQKKKIVVSGRIPIKKFHSFKINKTMRLRNKKIQENIDERKEIDLQKKKEQEERSRITKRSTKKIIGSVPFVNIKERFDKMNEKKKKKLREERKLEKEKLKNQKLKRKIKLEKRPYLFESSYSIKIRQEIMGEIEGILRNNNLSEEVIKKIM